MKTGRYRVVAFVCACLAALAASQPAQGDPPRVRTDMLVTTDWLARHLDDSDIVIVDVAKARTGYDKEHIPGARLLLWDEIVTTRDGIPNEIPPVERLVEIVRRLGITDASRVILYDEEMGLSAARAYVTFDYLGLGEHASLLDGQWKRWRREERPVVAESTAVKPSTFEPQLHPQVVASLGKVRDLVEKRQEAASAIIDARPAEQYAGNEAGDGVGRPGHIPGASSIPWTQNILSADDPALRPLDELRAVYANAGVMPGRPAIAYCRTGVQAAYTYFTLRYLGYNPQLYDGSFIEWSAQNNLPIERSR